MSETKEKILEAAAELIHHKGFNYTGIQEILTKAGVPKGSFYFYFKNKEDLGIQLIDYFSTMSIPIILEFLNDEAASPLQRMRSLFDNFLIDFEKNNFIGGCPIGNLCQEMGDISKPFRDKLKTSLTGLRDIFAQFIDLAKAENEISDGLDTHEISDFIVSSWEGSILQAKVMKSTAPLLNFEKMVFDVILKK
jgi:TetR/AcrR family transcriptional repressor of nem operon